MNVEVLVLDRDLMGDSTVMVLYKEKLMEMLQRKEDRPQRGIDPFLSSCVMVLARLL